MSISSIFSEPHEWDAAFLGTRPLLRTSLFWSCFIAFFYAALMTGGIAIKIALQIPSKAPLLIPFLLLMVIFIFYTGWRFLRFIREVQAILLTIPEKKEAILSLARWNARLFAFAMTGIGLAMVLALVLRAG